MVAEPSEAVYHTALSCSKILSSALSLNEKIYKQAKCIVDGSASEVVYLIAQQAPKKPHSDKKVMMAPKTITRING